MIELLQDIPAVIWVAIIGFLQFGLVHRSKITEGMRERRNESYVAAAAERKEILDRLTAEVLDVRGELRKVREELKAEREQCEGEREELQGKLIAEREERIAIHSALEALRSVVEATAEGLAEVRDLLEAGRTSSEILRRLVALEKQNRETSARFGKSGGAA